MPFRRQAVCTPETTTNTQRSTERVLAGLCWGAALLIRPQIVFMAPFLALGTLLCRAATRRRFLFEAAVQTAIVAAVAAPWVLRNAVVMGKPTLATLVGGHTFWGAHNDRTFHDSRVRGLWITLSDIPGGNVALPANELQQESIAWRNGIDSVRRNWIAVPQLLAWKLFRLLTPFEDTVNRAVYWAFALTWIVTAPIAAIGFRGLCQRDPVLGWVLGLQFAATVLCVLAFYGAVRFRHAVEPLLMMSTGVGATALATRRAEPCAPLLSDWRQRGFERA